MIPVAAQQFCALNIYNLTLRLWLVACFLSLLLLDNLALDEITSINHFAFIQGKSGGKFLEILQRQAIDFDLGSLELSYNLLCKFQQGRHFNLQLSLTLSSKNVFSFHWRLFFVLFSHCSTQVYNYIIKTTLVLINQMLDGQITRTHRHQIINSLKKALEGGYYTSRLKMKQVNDDGRFLKYDWEVVVPSRTGGREASYYYDCKLNFSYDYEFQRLELKEYDPLKEYHDDQRRKQQYYRFQDQQKKKEQPHSYGHSGNQFYQKPTDWEAISRAQLQESNRKFREKINNQARDWNYAKKYR